MTETTDLQHTPLDALHRELGARMGPFAGYDMPIQYVGVLAEHTHTRASAGLFDVSHMGQAFLIGADHESVAAALETLLAADVCGLAHGQVRYSFLTNDDGGIIDDLMVTRSASRDDDGKLMLVVNASRKDVDYEWISGRLPGGVSLEPVTDRALVALQGPAARAVMARLAPKVAELSFMTATSAEVGGIDCHVGCSGYTGEDGYEISAPAGRAEELARLLLGQPEVAPIGLGARDSLRLEAGLCLYGQDIDETTSPVEAGLTWAIAKSRREIGGFPGDRRILREIAEGPARRRVGIRPDGRAPARAGTQILAEDGTPIGTVTSGGFGPTVGGPVSMGYVAAGSAAPGTRVLLDVRGKHLAAQVIRLPFVPHRYQR